MSTHINEEVAYTMQEEYRKNQNRANACIAVGDKHPELTYETLGYMWDAIDAYVDMEGENE